MKKLWSLAWGTRQGKMKRLWLAPCPLCVFIRWKIFLYQVEAVLGKKSELSRLKRGETANCMISHKHKSTYKLFTWLALSFCCNYLPFFFNRENTPSVLTLPHWSLVTEVYT